MSDKHFSFLGWRFLVRGDYVEARWPGRRAVTTWPKRPGKNGSGFYDLCKQIFEEKPIVLTREEADELAAWCEERLKDVPQRVEDERVWDLIEKLSLGEEACK
jgi:hypothetical protein